MYVHVSPVEYLIDEMLPVSSLSIRSDDIFVEACTQPGRRLDKQIIFVCVIENSKQEDILSHYIVSKVHISTSF